MAELKRILNYYEGMHIQTICLVKQVNDYIYFSGSIWVVSSPHHWICENISLLLSYINEKLVVHITFSHLLFYLKPESHYIKGLLVNLRPMKHIEQNRML